MHCAFWTLYELLDESQACSSAQKCWVYVWAQASAKWNSLLGGGGGSPMRITSFLAKAIWSHGERNGFKVQCIKKNASASEGT